MLKLYVVEKQNFRMARVINDRSCLTLMHSQRPKLYECSRIKKIFIFTFATSEIFNF